MSSTSARTGRWGDGYGRAATRSLQTLIILAIVVVVTYVGVQLRLVVVPVLIALLFAAAASPMVDWLDRRLPRLVAVWSTILLGLAVLAGVGYLVGDSVASQFGELREGAVQGFQQLQDFIASGPFGLPALDADELTSQLESVLQGSAVQSGAVTGAAAVAQIATGVLLAVVVLFFLLKDGRQIWAFFRGQLPVHQHRRFDLIGVRSVGVLGGYVRGTATVALVDAVLIGIGLVLVGVPLALPLALLTFVAAFVPIVGAVAAGAVAILVALVSNGPVDALIVLVIVIGVQQVESNFLQPVLMGRYLSLHPLVILLALAAGSIVAGVIGAILSVPLAAVVWAAVQASREATAEAERVEHEVRESGAPSDPDLGDPSPGKDVAPKRDDLPADAPSRRTTPREEDSESAGSSVKRLIGRLAPRG